jgi:hypothetical protein
MVGSSPLERTNGIVKIQDFARNDNFFGMCDVIVPRLSRWHFLSVLIYF